jgi:hypothetical protein
MHQLAFCFLIYDKIHHEELWNKFFEKVDPSKYRIYIHYKINMPLKYFESYKLKDCIETKYADISLVNAQNIMLKHALSDGCTKMINLSQACIPFKSFEHIYNFLSKDDMCHFNIAPHKACFPRCNSLLQYYPSKNIQKSAQWCILNRNIAELVISKSPEEITTEFSRVAAPDEHYYITMVYHNNLTDQIITTPNLANGATTFINWGGMDYKYPSSGGLKNYSSILPAEIKHLLHSPCLFGRKFTPECAPYLQIPIYLNSIAP